MWAWTRRCRRRRHQAVQWRCTHRRRGLGCQRLYSQDGGELHVRYVLLDGSAREKWATAADCRQQAVPDTGSVATRRALPPPRRGAAAAHGVPGHPGTAQAPQSLAQAPARRTAFLSATTPLRAGDAQVEVFSASAGRWVEAVVVEVDNRAGGEYRVSYVIDGAQRQKWVGGADVRRLSPALPRQDMQQRVQHLNATELAVGTACQIFSASASTWVRATLLELDNGEAVRPTSFLCSANDLLPTCTRPY